MLNIRQGNKETLRQFVDIFCNATFKVPDLPAQVALSAMLQRTRLTLRVTLGLDPQSVTRQVNFMVVKAPSVAYNMILGRPILNDIRVVVSSCYQLMKFPSLARVGQV